MAANQANTLLNSRRPLVIVLMLSVALVLISVLGWQSWQLQRSHMETADAVLHDYGILAADEFSRRIIPQLGYQGYYTLISQTAGLTSTTAMREQLESNPDLAGVASLASTFFVLQNDLFDVEGPDLSPAMKNLLRNAANSESDKESPYLSRRTADGKEQAIFAQPFSQEHQNRMVGFVVANAGISHLLKAAFDQGPLLPASLADGKVHNEMIFARISDPSGVVLFEENPEFDSPLKVQKTLGADYQGVVENFTIEISLDSYSADTLIIGGLPRSRLPFFLVAMVLVMALMISAIWLFRREQAVIRLRSDFVSQVSHELRTPLTQIRMFAETLLMNRARNDNEKQRSLEIINRESQRLSHLVENILRFSNGSDEYQPELTRQALAPTIEEVCNVTQRTNHTVQFELELDQSVEALVDADALRQILLNLIDNAIKYGPQDQTIGIELTRLDDDVQIRIQDEGPGIPVAEREKVFSPFYRMRREEMTAIAGTGIGLSVVRRLCETMNGACFVETSDSGTRICVVLPDGTAHG